MPRAVIGHWSLYVNHTVSPGLNTLPSPGLVICRLAAAVCSRNGFSSGVLLIHR